MANDRPLSPEARERIARGIRKYLTEKPTVTIDGIEYKVTEIRVQNGSETFTVGTDQVTATEGDQHVTVVNEYTFIDQHGRKRDRAFRQQLAPIGALTLEQLWEAQGFPPPPGYGPRQRSTNPLSAGYSKRDRPVQLAVITDADIEADRAKRGGK